MYGSDEVRLMARFEEAKRAIQTIERLARNQASGFLCGSVDFEEYLISRMDFDQEPDFDAKNPYDGPNVNDEKCLKRLKSSSSGKELYVVHPKVVRWISGAKKKLEALENMEQYLNICSEVAEMDWPNKGNASLLPAKSCSSGKVTLLDDNVEDEVVDEESTYISRLTEPVIKVRKSNNVIFDENVVRNCQTGTRRRLTCYAIHSRDAAYNVPWKIRRQKMDDRTTIGQALGYWWGEKFVDGEKTRDFYAQRVKILVKIRSLYEPPEHQPRGPKVCWWCPYSKHCGRSVRSWAVFAGERERPTCSACRDKMMRRCGCWLGISSTSQWKIELPRVFDQEIDFESAIRKLIQLNLGSKQIEQEWISRQKSTEVNHEGSGDVKD